MMDVPVAGRRPTQSRADRWIQVKNSFIQSFIHSLFFLTYILLCVIILLSISHRARTRYNEKTDNTFLPSCT